MFVLLVRKILSADHPVSVTCIDPPEKLPDILWERLGEVVVPVTVQSDIPASNEPLESLLLQNVDPVLR